MRFLVYGRDGEKFDYGPNDLDEAHQSYMDGWLPVMIGRGPTLSPDGADHTGSVHVIEVDDIVVARRFATEEPYASAGWYAEVSVWPMRSLAEGTMWDRPRPAQGQESSFVLVRWPAQAIDEGRFARLPWLFGGLLLDESADCVGVAGALDLASGAAGELLGELPGTVEVHRWARGGRPDPSA